MIIKRIPAGIYAANCYIVMDEKTKDSVVIDIGGDEDDIIKNVQSLNANIKAILLTHGHMDHVSGVLNFKKVYDVPVYMSSADEELMKKDAFMFGSFGNFKTGHNVNDGDVIQCGSLKFKVLATPGHTPGGLCFLTDKNVFTGDTLFLGSVGRTDFEGGSQESLIKSIKDKLMCLQDDITVWCGHGPKTSIGRERKYNPFF